jgi:L-ascorbate metabolism protein UlaG (beta-lactamase superfamily)
MTTLFCLLGATVMGADHRADIEGLATGEVRLELAGSAGEYYRWDVSENLLHWQPLVTWLSQGSDLHTDSAAPYHTSRFYAAVALSSPPLLTGDHLVTAEGLMVIQPVNHATLVLEHGGTMIYVDPVGGASQFGDLPRADLILITHSHGDHLNSATVDAVRGSGAAIVAPSAVYGGLNAAQRPLTTVLANGASASLKGITIDAVPAYNLTAGYHPQGVGNGYVLTIGGKRVYIAGDTEDTPAMRALEGIDIAFLPLNMPYTMTVAKGVSAVREFRPKVVYPYHYRNQDGTFADLSAFKEQVGTDLGIEVRLREWY